MWPYYHALFRPHGVPGCSPWGGATGQHQIDRGAGGCQDILYSVLSNLHFSLMLGVSPSSRVKDQYKISLDLSDIHIQIFFFFTNAHYITVHFSLFMLYSICQSSTVKETWPLSLSVTARSVTFIAVSPSEAGMATLLLSHGEWGMACGTFSLSEGIVASLYVSTSERGMALVPISPNEGGVLSVCYLGPFLKVT